MLSATEAWYRLKKAYSIYPGVDAPVSGGFLAPHYRRRQQGRGAARAQLDAAIGRAFLAWVPGRARAVAARHGLPPAWIGQAVAIARTRFADPNDIALFRIEHEAQLDPYIRRFEDAGLNKRINPAAWTPDCALADKIRFYERCAAHDLPHPRVFATIVGGRTTRLADPTGPLLLKPARGEGGRGVTAIATLAEARPDRHPALVQARIATHPALAAIALNALPTARLTTIVGPDGPEPVNAVLRIPVDPAAVVDNMKAGGILSPIDLAGGTLGIACKGYGGGDIEAHPVTGTPIPGLRLPDWAAAKALAVDAHARAFADYAMVGWDIGFSPDGPVLIEGNGKPGVLMPQRAGRAGLGGQRYGELLAWQLERADFEMPRD